MIWNSLGQPVIADTPPADEQCQRAQILQLAEKTAPQEKLALRERPGFLFADSLTDRKAAREVIGLCPMPTPSPLRVAFILHVMQVAGAEVLVAETIGRLAGRIDPVVLCLDAIGDLGKRLQAKGVPVICLQRRPGRDWKVAWRLAHELKARRIQVIHAHQYTPFFYAALACAVMARSPKLILTEHGRHFPDVVSPLRRAANRLLLDHLADAINACCGFSADALCRVDGFAGRRIEVIENGIEVERYGTVTDRAALCGKLGLDSSRRYIITVARFHPVKDHATLLNAFALVAKDRPDVDLLLVGDGPLRGELEGRVRTLDVAARVNFLGVRADISTLLSTADVFALTSLSEAASLTVLEAMASRLPVVVTTVGGNPEMVRDGVEGLLVPRGDVGGTARALSRLLDKPAEAATMGAAGRARVEGRYQLSNTVAKYWQLYRRLSGRGF